MNVSRSLLLAMFFASTGCYASGPANLFGDDGGYQGSGDDGGYQGSGDDGGNGNPGTGGGQDAGSGGNTGGGGGQDAGHGGNTGGGQDAGNGGNTGGGQDAGGSGNTGHDAGSTPPPADAGGTTGVDAATGEDASSGGATATWTYLYPTYFEGTSTSQTPGHCSSSCHNHSSDGSNTATSSTLVQKAYKDNLLALQGGDMPQDNTSWSDSTALSLIEQWATAGYPQ